MKGGFTLIEVLIALSIVLVLYAILLPVFKSAKHQANVTTSVENLHQLSLALILYRTDHDGDSKYGDLADMGLPDQAFVNSARFINPNPVLHSPCGQHPDEAPPGYTEGYTYWPGNGGEPLIDDVQLYRENYIVFDDMNCTEHDIPLFNDGFTVNGLGVLLGGRLVNKSAKGEWYKPEWWSDPEP